MEEKFINEIKQNIQEAIKSGEHCLRHVAFPDNYPKTKFRWFLTRNLTEDMPKNVKDPSEQISRSGTHLIFIGMNPAEATYFGSSKDCNCGDKTCARIINAFANKDLPDSFYPVSRLTFINLVPIVGKNPSEAKEKWVELKKNHSAILEINVATLEKILDMSNNIILIPAFGVQMKPSDWKYEGFKKIFSFLKNKVLYKKNIRILSVKNNFHPRSWPSNETLKTAFEPALENLQQLAQKDSVN